ncbi:MAG TPA: Calx-beta domain-containing protein [Frankiaceae bacterium]|jgi:hypothetical protein|nr:Calx-beta domain-containing protein [Frankiaceae bacterium]
MSIVGVMLAGSASAATILIVDDDLACPGATFSTIGSAVDAAGDGDTIRVCAGLYIETVSDQGKGLTLLGPQADVIPSDFPAPGGEAVIDGQSGDPVVQLGSGTTLNGFTVQDGKRGIIAGSGATVRSNSFKVLATGLQVFSNVVVADNLIQADTVGVRVDPSGADDTKVSGNAFRGSFSSAAIDESGGSGDDDPVMNLSVTGNTYAAPAGGGAFLEATHTVGLKITGNTLDGPGAVSELIGLDPSDHDWTVSGNRISNAGGDGVVVACSFGAGDTMGGGSVTQNLFSNIVTAIEWGNGGGSCDGDFEIHSNVFPASDGTFDPHKAAVFDPTASNVHLENNYWGCNLGPGQGKCSYSIGSDTGDNRYLVLLSAIGTKTLSVGQSTPFTASLNHNNLGETVALPVLDGTPIFFSSSTYLSVTPGVGTFTGGTATAVVKAKQPPGTAGIGGQSVSGVLESATTTQNGITIKASSPPPPPPPALPALTVHDASTTEGKSGTHVMYFSVTLSKKYTKAVTVKFATGNGTAKAPTDYVAKTGTLTFPAGVTSKAIGITIKGDKIKEPNETFVVTIYAPVNAKIADPNALGVIRNS